MHEHSISFMSLGLLVLDEIRFPNRKPLTDVLGGSGAYGLIPYPPHIATFIYNYPLLTWKAATLGARLFLPQPRSFSLGWMIHIGNDFPMNIRAQLRSWNATLVEAMDPEKPSTRGLLEYKDTTFGRAEYPPPLTSFFLSFFFFTHMPFPDLLSRCACERAS